MAKSECIILLDLHEFFADDRQRSIILINQNYKKIKDLEDRISDIFGIKEFHLLINDHLLPSCEDIALLKSGDTVCIKPNIFPSNSLLLSGLYYTNNSNTSVEGKTISNNEMATTQLVQECNEVEASSKRNKVSKKRKVKHKVINGHEESNEILGLYSIKPNNSEINTVSTDFEGIQQNEVVIETNSLQSYNKKKRKRKSEINAGEDYVSDLKKYKEGKHTLLDEESQKASNLENKCKKTVTQENFNACKYETTQIIENNESKAKMIFMNDDEEQMNNKNYTHLGDILKFTKDERINDSGSLVDSVLQKNSKSSAERSLYQKQQSEKFEKKIFNSAHITECNKIQSQPLPFKKAKDITSWRTTPLSKTINLVKIIKVPTVKIEIDYSRFLNIPDPEIDESNENISDITSKTSKISIPHNFESQNISRISPQKKLHIDSNNPSHLDINSQNYLDQHNTELIQFNNCSQITQDTLKQKKCINSSDLDQSLFTSEENDLNCREIKKKELMPHPNSTDENSLFNSYSQDVNCSDMGFDHLKLIENSQKIESLTKSEARELWRQKINQKYIQNYENSEKELLKTVNRHLNMDQLCMNSSVKGSKNFFLVENKIEEKNSRIEENTKEEFPIDIFKNMIEFSGANSKQLTVNIVPNKTYNQELQFAVLRSENEVKNRMIELSSGVETSVDSIDEDLVFSNTTEKDGNFVEPKRRRRRRHKKKIKEIFPKKVENTSREKTFSWIPAKPKLHLRFNDFDNVIPVQSDVTNPGDQIIEIGEKIKILGDVSIIPEVNSQGKTELIDYENKIGVKSSIEDNDIPVESDITNPGDQIIEVGEKIKILGDISIIPGVNSQGKTEFIDHENKIKVISSIEDNSEEKKRTTEHRNTKQIFEIESLDNTLMKLKAELLKTIDTLKSDSL